MVEADEGLRAPSNHLALTATAKMKRRERKLVPLANGAASALANMPVTASSARVLTVEGMLQVRSDARPEEGVISSRCFLGPVITIHLVYGL